MRSWTLCLAVAVLAGPAARVSAAGARGSSGQGAPQAMDARALAARVDAAIAARWAEAKVKPVARADDGEFLRRVCLDLIGKIPTAAEAGDFLDDPRRDKRIALVERLLDSPAYTAHATQLWRKLLLPEADTENQARQVVDSFEAWLRRKVAEDAGYDRIVRELLTTRLTADRNTAAMAVQTVPSPAAYYVAKEGKPENLASGVSRVFLGVRLECAQCHNHPFAQWKREQFWGFAAFFAGVPAQGADDDVVEQRPSRDPAAKRTLTIPGTKKVVTASHLDGSPPAWRPRADSREVLADWITAPGNPYFARAVVNRVWARFFGLGLVEPVDDLDVDEGSEFSGLLDELAVQFRLHQYDLKYLIRVITATRVYNLSSTAGAEEPSTPLFTYMPVRGLSAGQFFDSLAQATGNDTPEARTRFLERFAAREERATEAQTSILQALTMMNGAQMATVTSPDSGNVLGAIARAPYLDTPGRIETLYLATLTRRPRPEEQALLVRYVDGRTGAEAQAKALSDVFWALLNGPEFHLNH